MTGGVENEVSYWLTMDETANLSFLYHFVIRSDDMVSPVPIITL